MSRFGGAIALACSLLLVACGSPQLTPPAAAAPTRSAAPAAHSADAYVRPLDGVTYTQMAPDVERQIASLFAGKAITYAFRDVGLTGPSAKLRLVVLEMTDAYAAAKPLDDVHGMGGPNSYPDKKVIGGLPTFLHADATPNFLAWQQRQYLVLVYGTERPAMESLAAPLIAANR